MSEQGGDHKKKLIVLAVGFLFVVGFVCLWKLTPAALYISPRHIAPYLTNLQHSVWAIPAIIGIFIVGTLVFFPLTILIIATSIAFPPPESFFLALTGALSGASFGYGVGRLLGLRFLRFLTGKSADKVSHYTKNGGVLAVTFLRMVPIAPLGIVDLSLGIAKVPFPIYLLGSLLGLLPGIIAFCFLGHSLGRLWLHRRPEDLLYVAAAALLWGGIIVGTHFLVKQRRPKVEAPPV